MSDYTRLTVHGSRNRAELVLPSDEPLVAMLPDVLDLLDEPEGAARPITLVTVLGEQLDASLSLAEQDVRQGSIVRLVRLDEAPPPPEVADVTELAGASVEQRADRWRREWAVLAVAAVSLGIGRLLSDHFGARPAQHSWLWAAAGALTVVAIVLARQGRRTGAAIGTAALAAGLTAAPSAALVAGQPAGAGVGAWLAVGALIAALVAGLGIGDRGVALGGALGAVLVAGWAGLGLLGVPPLDSAGVIGVAAVLGLGLLPGLAMSVSGLSGLDDRVVEGRTVLRPAAAEALTAVHRGLSWATIGVSAVAAVAGYQLGVSRDGWAMGLAGACASVLALRTRVLPLAPQRLALFGAAAATLAGVALSAFATSPALTAGLLVVLAVALIGAVAVPAGDNLRARLARLGNLVELVAVVATVPLLLGLLGLYDDLLAAF